MAILDATKQQIVELQNQVVPQEGPKGMPLTLNFDASTSEILISLLNASEQQRIALVQCIWIDLSDSANPMEVSFEGSAFRIVAMPNTQGFYPVLAPNPAKMRFRMALGSGVQSVVLLNVAIAGVSWSATAF